MRRELIDLTVEVTQRCPNSCLFCSSLSHPNSRVQVSLEDVCSVARQAASLGLERISISGGEPLCHPKLCDILSELYQLGLQVSLYTTGISLNDTDAFSFVKWDLLDSMRTNLIFSVQSTQSHIHDKLTRRKGSFGLTQRSIHAAKLSGFHVEVHLVPNKINLQSIEASVSELSEWGVDQVSFLRLVPQGYARDYVNELSLSQSESCLLQSTFQSISEQDFGNTKVRFGIPFSSLVNKCTSCFAGENKLIVKYDGIVYPCEAFKESGTLEFRLGDIRQDSLQELLLRGRNLRALRILKSCADFSEPCPAQLYWANRAGHNCFAIA